MAKHQKHSRHVVDLREVIPGLGVRGRQVDDVKHPNLNTSTHASVHHNNQTQHQNIRSVAPPVANHLPSRQILKDRKFRFSDKTKSVFSGLYMQMKSAMQFVALTSIIFVLLFGLSNFSAYSDIISYWYSTEVIKADKIETQIDQVIKTPDKQNQESIVFSQGKVSQINFQVRPPDYRIYIPKINKNLPIVDTSDFNLTHQKWDELEKDIQNDLRRGVTHYPGTAQPGVLGNVFLTAHSSWYPNDILPYGLSSAFALLHKLVAGDKIYIFKSGEMYVYTVRDKFTVKPSNVSVLDQPVDKREMTLMTCTPVGTTINRLIVKLDQTYPKMQENIPEDAAPDVPNLYNDGRLQS